MKKAFSQELFDQNDTPAREKVKRSFAEIWGLTLVDNSDKYGPDLVAYRGSVFEGFVEIEVKHNWLGNRFPFPTVHFPKRKERIFGEGPMIFVVMNKHMTHFIWFRLNSLKSARVITKRTRLTDFQEGFLEIPVSEGIKVTCSDYAS